MIIDRNIQRCIIFSEDSVLNALKKMSDNKIRIIFALSESGVLHRPDLFPPGSNWLSVLRRVR